MPSAATVLGDAPLAGFGVDWVVMVVAEAEGRAAIVAQEVESDDAKRGASGIL